MNQFIKDKGVQFLVGFFVLSSLLTILLNNQLADLEIDSTVVLVGNLILFFSTLMAYRIFSKQISGKSGQAVVRNVYAGFVLKFFILATTAMVYFYFAKEINLRGVLVCLVFYLIYNFINTRYAASKKGLHAPPPGSMGHKPKHH